MPQRRAIYRHNPSHSFLFNFFGGVWIVHSLLFYFFGEFLWHLYWEEAPIFRFEDRVVLQILGGMFAVLASLSYCKKHLSQQSIAILAWGHIITALMITMAFWSYRSIIATKVFFYPILLLVEAAQMLVSVLDIVPIHEPMMRYRSQRLREGVDSDNSRPVRASSSRLNAPSYDESSELNQDVDRGYYTSKPANNYGSGYEQDNSEWKEGLIPKFKRWFGIGQNNNNYADDEYYDNSSNSNNRTFAKGDSNWDQPKKYTYDVSDDAYYNPREQEILQQADNDVNQPAVQVQQLDNSSTTSRQRNLPDDKSKLETKTTTKIQKNPKEIKEKVETERVYNATTTGKTD